EKLVFLRADAAGSTYTVNSSLRYHSFRHSVTTKLFRAGPSEAVVGELTGHGGTGRAERSATRVSRWQCCAMRLRRSNGRSHDKPSMTSGLYSGGASLKVKREAIERLTY